NVRDAMPHGGKLTIETENTHLDKAYAHDNAEVAPGQYVMIAVSDTGIGMSADTLEKAFDPFFTTKEAGQGTGLGLSQVHGFVKQTGGHIKLYSELGQGTTVKLYLPRSANPGVSPREDNEQPPLPVESRSEVILVVEDNELLSTSVAAALQEQGYRVLTAPNATTALHLLDQQQEVQLLFTDVGLPGGVSGRQLADEARRRRPDLAVLFTTGYTRNAIIHQGRLDPGVELIVKPFTHTSLLARIQHLLEQRGKSAVM
ncbi:MAG: response regulator, partial [Acetobacteraceae bacterium]|nr:response regulator [Acetobacteraceae bacterium]